MKHFVDLNFEPLLNLHGLFSPLSFFPTLSDIIENLVFHFKNHPSQAIIARSKTSFPRFFDCLPLKMKISLNGISCNFVFHVEMLNVLENLHFHDLHDVQDLLVHSIIFKRFVKLLKSKVKLLI